jgi:endonuclease/exonuclease/phosphatase family metal-dependent hydrolase
MHYDNKSGDTSGIAVVSRLSFETTVFRFAGSSEKLPVFDKTNFESMYNSQRFELLIIVLNYAGKIFTIATTHLPVTGNGLSTSFQFKAMRELLNFLNTIPSFVLTGDLNTPRGGEVFDQIARRYTDNIPRNYSTSIDQKLHRAAPLELMVDGLFSTNDYLVTNVRLQCGVSDHCAVCSEVFIKN